MALSLRVNTTKPDRYPIRIQTAQGTLVIRATQRQGMGNHQVLLTFDGPREIFTILRGQLGDGGDEGGEGDGTGQHQPDAGTGDEGAHRATGGR